MVINTKNCFNLQEDQTLPNIIKGLKNKLLSISEIQGLSVNGTSRKNVSDVVFVKIHDFIKKSKNEKNIDLDDILTYVKNVSSVNKTALQIIYKAVTSKELPEIIYELYLIKEFISEGYKGLEEDEKPFFRKNYYSNQLFLMKPIFSGSSVISINDIRIYHKLEEFITPFEKLMTILHKSKEIIDVVDGYIMSKNSKELEQIILTEVKTKCKPLVTVDGPILFKDLFSEEQKTAITSILRSTSKINCLTGKAGTGKTKVISSIIDNAHANNNSIVCCSFTGKAASRIAQSDIDVKKILYPPKTIHSLMGTIKSSESFVKIDLVVIDEASTLNNELFYEFLNVLGEHSNLNNIKFILVGDCNQLPPIGSGQIFEDILSLKLYPIHTLTKIYRTTDEKLLSLYNSILETDHMVKTANFKEFICKYNSKDVENTMKKLVDGLFKTNDFWYKDNKCVIISHTNKYVDYINYLCYKRVTGNTIPFYETIERKEGIGWQPLPIFWEGAKIIFTKNDKIDLARNGGVVSVTNGTIGEVLRISGGLVQIKNYDDGTSFWVDYEYDNVKLAYAMTVYKSQGSEASFVIYFHSNSVFESKSLVYTAVTRAQDNLLIYTPLEGFKMSLNVGRITSLNSEV